MKGEAHSDPETTARSSSSGPSIHGLFTVMGVQVAAFLPFFSLFLHHRGLRPDRIGLVTATLWLSGLLATSMWGLVADTSLGRLYTLRLTGVLAAGAALALGGVGNWAAILLATIALAVCWTPLVPLGDALALQHLGPERRRSYGRIRLWMSGGFAVAAPAFGALFTQAGLRTLPTVFSVSLLILVAWSMVALSPTATPPGEPTTTGLRAVGTLVLAGPRLLLMLAAGFLVTTGVSAILTFVPLRIGGLGGTPFLVGVAAGLAAVVEIPAMVLSGRIIRKLGLRGTFVLGALVYAGGFALLSAASSPVAIVVVVSLNGIGFALIYVGMVVIVDTLVVPSLRATGQGLRHAVMFGLAPILGAAGGGLLYGPAGPGALFLVASGLAIAGAATGWIVLSMSDLGSDFAVRGEHARAREA